VGVLDERAGFHHEVDDHDGPHRRDHGHRHAPKPASPAELRVASTCEPVTDMRGSAPTEECLAQWRTPVAAKASQENLELFDESFAATVALAALALYA